MARLEPVTQMSDQETEGRLVRLERAGLIRRGKGKLSPEFFRLPRPKPKNGASVLEALLEERREGR